MGPPDRGTGQVAVDPDAIWGLGTQLRTTGEELTRIAQRVRNAVAGLGIDLPAATTIGRIGTSAAEAGDDLHRRVSRYLEAVAAARCAPNPHAVEPTPGPDGRGATMPTGQPRPWPSPLATPDPDVPRYDDPCAPDLSEFTHLLLDGAGWVPGAGEIADGINAALYALEGDPLNAGISLAGMVPGAGIAATGARVVRRTGLAITGDGGAALAKIGIRRSDEIRDHATWHRQIDALRRSANLSAATLNDHVLSRHSGRMLGKSAFARDVDVTSLIGMTIDRGKPFRGLHGAYVFELIVDTEIGTFLNRFGSGSPTAVMTVVVGPAGNIRAAYPGPATVKEVFR